MKYIKYIIAAVWLIFCVVSIATNYSHYGPLDYVIVISVALMPFLIYFFVAQNKKRKKLNETKDYNNAIVQFDTVPTTPIGSTQPNASAKKPRSFFVPIFAIVAIVFLAGTMIFINMGKGKLSDSSPNVSSNVSKSELATVMNLTDEQESVMLSLFKSCGIGELSSVKEFHVGEERTSYHIDDVETSAYVSLDNTIVVWVDNETKTVQEIYFSDETIYADGEVQGQVTDYYISEEARSNYRVIAQMYIDQLLNYPDTAKYPNRSGWAFGVVDGLDVAQSSVTAKNAFGMSDTVQFTIKFDRKTSKVVSLIFDGKEYIE